jgi:hypothetical protein
VLSVFAGSFTMADAQGVSDAGPALAHLIRGLVDSSWLVVTRGSEHNRFSMLDTMRTFAAARLAEDRDDLGGGAANTNSSAIIVHSDGSISVPMTTVGDSFKIKSGSVVWPSAAQLASGQPQHDTLVMTMTMLGHTSTIKAHVVVKGEGTHAVTVPAGSYQATVIDEVMAEKFSGVAITMDIRTWVANGVGPVKTEITSNAAGRTAIVNNEVLKSFTKG